MFSVYYVQKSDIAISWVKKVVGKENEGEKEKKKKKEKFKKRKEKRKVWKVLK